MQYLILSRQRRLWLGACLMLSLVLVLTGCSGGGGGSSSTGNGNPLNLTVTAATGSLTLPTGATVDTKSLTVVNSLGETQPAADGTFSTSTYTDGPALSAAFTADGKPLLLGWLGGTHTALNANTTAETLAYFALGLYLRPDGLRTQMPDLLASASELDPLRAAVATAIANPPDGGIGANPGVQTALHNLETQFAPSSPFVRDSKSASPLARAIGNLNPAEGYSGLNVDIADGVNSLKIHNSYRRRCYAFVDRLSYTPASTSIPVASPATIQSFAVPTPGGFSYGHVDTMLNAVGGSFAYSEVVSDPIQLPVYPDETTAKSTDYQVTIVGPGKHPGDNGGVMTGEQTEKYQEMVRDTVIKDLFLPFLIDTILPLASDGLDDHFGDKTSTIVLDLASVIAITLPDWNDRLKAGDTIDLYSELLTTLATSEHFREAVYEIVQKSLFTSPIKQVAYSKLQAAVETTLMGMDIALMAVDFATQATHWNDSNNVDIWTMTAVKPVVTITPITQTIGMGDTVRITGGCGELAARIPLPCWPTTSRTPASMATSATTRTPAASSTAASTGWITKRR